MLRRSCLANVVVLVVLGACAGSAAPSAPEPAVATTAPAAPAPAAPTGVVGTTIDHRAALPPEAVQLAALDVAAADGHRFVLGRRGNNLVLRTLVWTTHLPADEEGYEEPVLAGLGFEVLENPNRVRVRWNADGFSDGGAHVDVHVEWDTANGGIAGLDFEGSVMAHTPDAFFEDD